jgi:sulfate adenylyltransferase (ADP) / adenylylsulfatase
MYVQAPLCLLVALIPSYCISRVSFLQLFVMVQQHSTSSSSSSSGSSSSSDIKQTPQPHPLSHQQLNMARRPTKPPTTTTATTTPNTITVHVPQMKIPLTYAFHNPPSTTSTSTNAAEYYKYNTTPFGAILRGESPARIIQETDTLLAFVDRSPQSQTLHALIIPKRFISTIEALQPSPQDIALLQEMETLGYQLLQRYSCNHNFRMVFHVPPYNTVDHLHLHVLCDTDLSIFGRTVKYVYDTPWCISFTTLLQQLQKSSSSTTSSSSTPLQVPPTEQQP